MLDIMNFMVELPYASYFDHILHASKRLFFRWLLLIFSIFVCVYVDRLISRANHTYLCIDHILHNLDHVDIDECRKNQTICSGNKPICKNQPGSYTCEEASRMVELGLGT